jgi:hypothetical protein
MDSKRLLAYLEKLEKKSGLKVNGNTYTLEQVKLAQRISADVAAELGFQPSKPKLSRRRAFIVILEELYFDIPEYPMNIILTNINSRAVQRFEFAQRTLKGFSTPQEIHPKDACRYYENNGIKRMNYRRALAYLVNYQSLLFQVSEAAESLEDKYREVLLCS